MSGTANVQAAYPGKPGAGWQDDEGACWVLCADGKMRLLVETEEPEDPAELDARFGPMLPLDSNQQPADVVTAEQQQDGAAEDVTAFLDAWEADRGFGNAIRGGNGDIPYLFATDLRAVLAERTALAARVAEQREDVAAARRERDEAKAETAKLNAYLTLVVARYGNQTFYERDVKRAAALSAALAHDAAPEALSEPVERSETSGGIGTASNSSAGTAGLSERCPCGCPKIGDGCNCRYCNEPYPTRQPNDDTTEDGR